MNCRKLLTRHEEYLKSIEDNPEQIRAATHFYNQLRNYYRRKWGVNLKLPRVNGIEVNLYKLYIAVKAFGGWCRVTNADKWYDVSRDALGIGEETTSADYCARLIYMRYLSKFEQFEQGADTDDHDNEMMSSRNRIRGYSLYVTSECPVHIPKREPLDEQFQYDKLTKSLASSLPNEVDFALNTCAILSAPGPFVFNLDRQSGLITLIVGQAGVFDDNSDILQEEFIRAQKRTTKRDFLHFWSTAGISDPDVLKIFSMVKPNKYSELDYQLFPLLKNEQYEQKQIDTVEYRVQQVLDIVRNLSFEAHNAPLLANNWACLKFLVICISTELNELKNSALDALSELASQICLSTDLLTTILLRLLKTFLFSEDRILVMRAAEVIGSLCINPENESIMCDYLDNDILRRLFELISIKDVLICVNTLDSLYNISEAGKTLCERLVDVPRGLELLVNFCTIEASQFTTNGLYGIKVIEYPGAHDQQMGHPLRPSTSYYHPQQQMHPRALPTPLQPSSIGGTRPQVVVSSKGDIAAVTNKPMLTRSVIPVMPNAHTVDYQKRDSLSMNGSQVQQIRIVNSNGDPIAVQQTSTSIVETTIKNEASETQQSMNEIENADETSSTINAEEDEDEEEDKMEIDESNAEQTTNNDEESKVELEIDEANEETINEDEVVTTKEPTLNGSDHKNGNNSDEHPVLNGVTKEVEEIKNNGSSTKENDDEEEILLNGSSSPNHVKENGCVQNGDDKEEKPMLNGSAKKSKSKAKKRPATDSPTEANANGSSNAKKSKTSPSPKKKNQKNGYIENKETPTETDSNAQSTTAQQLYGRVPNFMCEWDACTNFFHTGSAMIYHILHDHIEGNENTAENTESTTEPQTPTASTSNGTDACCRWPGCERTPRSKWSLITHLQENHCNDNALNMATRKRREIGDFNYVATIKQRLTEVPPVTNHPGYTKFAAYDAIRRHAFNYLARDITEDNQEGPVTRHLRLTSALILRNLAKNSAEGRKRLRPHEGFLSYLAMSRLENGSALSQCLAALNPVEI